MNLKFSFPAQLHAKRAASSAQRKIPHETNCCHSFLKHFQYIPVSHLGWAFLSVRKAPGLLPHSNTFGDLSEQDAEFSTWNVATFHNPLGCRRLKGAVPFDSKAGTDFASYDISLLEVFSASIIHSWSESTGITFGKLGLLSESTKPQALRSWTSSLLSTSTTLAQLSACTLDRGAGEH